MSTEGDKEGRGSGNNKDDVPNVEVKVKENGVLRTMPCELFTFHVNVKVFKGNDFIVFIITALKGDCIMIQVKANLSIT